MEIKNTRTGESETVEVREAQMEDIRKLTKKRFAFNWSAEFRKSKIYVLNIAGQNDILGAVSVNFVPEEFRIEINLLASSKENVGEKKDYEGIAGCLLAYVCRMSVLLFKEDACVSLIPKTILRAHYIADYNMIDAGKQVYVDGKRLIDLMNKFL
ncbi:MAG TPA: hypothetical protein VG890_00350 [Puia sp.]|nr:hypothetical protein [Puia sp.]